jgi:AcrR family transcriptional regulator
MNHVGNMAKRPYRSRLREEQAASTRDRILDGAMRVVASGIAGLTVPAVAGEAGVSVPTLYRYFRTKRDLLEAIYHHSLRRANVGELMPPASIADFREGVRVVFRRVESFDDVDWAGIGSPAADEIRHATIGSRLALTRQIADAIAPGLADEDRNRLARLLIILTTTASVRMWRDHLGLSLEEASGDVDWAVRAMIAGLRQEGAQ